jgi:hypothetical protein
MFKQGLYQYVPSITSAKALIALVWVMGLLIVLIGLHYADGHMSQLPAVDIPAAQVYVGDVADK